MALSIRGHSTGCQALSPCGDWAALSEVDGAHDAIPLATDESGGRGASQADSCLDGFIAKFRKLLPNRAAVQSPNTRVFLAEVFGRVLPTSTFAERIFARLNRWSDRKGPRPHLKRRLLQWV